MAIVVFIRFITEFLLFLMCDPPQTYSAPSSAAPLEVLPSFSGVQESRFESGDYYKDFMGSTLNISVVVSLAEHGKFDSSNLPKSVKIHACLYPFRLNPLKNTTRT